MISMEILQQLPKTLCNPSKNLLIATEASSHSVNKDPTPILMRGLCLAKIQTHTIMVIKI